MLWNAQPKNFLIKAGLPQPSKHMVSKLKVLLFGISSYFHCCFLTDFKSNIPFFGCSLSEQPGADASTALKFFKEFKLQSACHRAMQALQRHTANVKRFKRRYSAISGSAPLSNR